MRITRNQLRQLIQEAIHETLSETTMLSPTALNRTMEGMDTALAHAKEYGTLHGDTDQSDLLKFYQIMYKSQIDEGDSYKYIHDALKTGMLSKPITGMMISDMYKSLKLTPMTNDDWAHFNKIMYVT